MAEDRNKENGDQRSRGFLMLLVGDEQTISDAALGIALRGAGHNLRVHIMEFLKTGRERGEVAAVSLLTGVSLTQYGRVEVGEKEKEESAEGAGIAPDRLEAALKDAAAHVSRRVTNILILDGLLTLVDLGIVDEAKILDLVNQGAPWLDIVATGAAATAGLVDAADSITTMERIKTPKEEFQELRRGIHY
jgi:cob(I)alamin adenosyltransferase